MYVYVCIYEKEKSSRRQVDTRFSRQNSCTGNLRSAVLIRFVSAIPKLKTINMEQGANKLNECNVEGKSKSKPGTLRKSQVKLSKSFKENKKSKNIKRRSLPSILDPQQSPERKLKFKKLMIQSPKYIGIVETDGKRSRYGRTQKYKEDDDFLPTQIACYARHTPPKMKYVSPSNVYGQKFVPYESPIEKLIQKNKMLVTINNNINIETSPKSSRLEIKEKSTILDELEEIVMNNNQPASTNESSKTSSNYSNYDEENAYPPVADINSFASYYKSPSSRSTDSAKGSSIDLEIDFPIQAGDIFWARITPFPYWPCIVWPDPNGRTIVLNKNKVQQQNVKIHVRFFGDNGRRSWVNKSNILPYNGREEFDRRGVEYLRKHGKKHSMYRAFDVNAKKKFTWENAVAEADEVMGYAIAERNEMFEKVLDRQREIMTTERLRRRQSISANQFLNVPLLSATNSIKRERSPDIGSEDYDNMNDLQLKRPKIELDASFIPEDESESSNMDVALESVTEDSTLFTNSEFQSFYELIKKFVFRKENKSLEKYLDLNVKRIWCLRQLATTDDDRNTSMNIRRLSLRMKEISTTPNNSMTVRSSKQTDKVDRLKIEKKKPKSMEEVVEDIMDLNKNYLFKGLSKEPVCKICRCPSNLVKCAGSCQSLMHKDCKILKASTHVTGDSEEGKIISNNALVKFESSVALCPECMSGDFPNCYVCKKNDSELGEMIKCHINWCTQHYHIKCLKYWPQSKITKSSAKIESLLCPAHVCHTCVSDDPRGKFLQIEKSKLARCVECPATYHSDSFCIPAGTKFLTATQIVCPRHGRHEKININANWCFICASGGSLICCETCPTAFHLDCLKIQQSDDNYICEECETGRLPLYGELVWAKLGVYRWWPAIIIPPPDVPKNLQAKKHYWSDFCIRFFGSNDHTWINRSRVFLYQEGDWGKVNNTKGINQSYIQGLEEARRISELIKSKRLLKSNVRKDKGLAPLPYIKIKSNRPVAPVKLQEIDPSDLTPCDCTAKDEDPCGPYSGCLNRLLLTECNPKVCPAGKKCENQLFEKRIYPPLKVYCTNGKGWGLICEQELKTGEFIIEYVGEVIDDAEFQRRIAQKQEEKDENYYFLTLEKDYMIDAGPKGNLARFMNHSCEPNCETQKWTVNGITRIGLFAIKDIAAKTELTFNYHLECLGDNKKICHCGAEKCAGFIGSKYKEPIKPIALAVTTKKRNKIRKESQKPICF